MTNNTVDCRFCGEDTRGVPGCSSVTQALRCSHYAKTGKTRIIAEPDRGVKMMGMVRAKASYEPRIPRRVVLEMDGDFYALLIGCLRDHAANSGHAMSDGSIRVTSCGTAAQVRETIIASVEQAETIEDKP